jgi:two-component system, OmpR family, response regulator
MAESPRANGQEPIAVLVVARPAEDINGLMEALVDRGHTVGRACSAEEVARDVVGGRPDLVIIDFRSDDGIADRILSWVCRSGTSSTLVITELRQTGKRVRALQLGADDHLVAPFDVREGLARAETLIARREAMRESRLDAGDIAIDALQRAVIRNGELVSLTPRELELLMMLVKRAGQPVSKRELLCTVWRDEARSENVVEANVSSLRRKLHGLGPPVIHTLHRSGYVFRPVAAFPLPARATLVAQRERHASDGSSATRASRP